MLGNDRKMQLSALNIHERMASTDSDPSSQQARRTGPPELVDDVTPKGVAQDDDLPDLASDSEESTSDEAAPREVETRRRPFCPSAGASRRDGPADAEAFASPERSPVGQPIEPHLEESDPQKAKVEEEARRKDKAERKERHRLRVLARLREIEEDRRRGGAALPAPVNDGITGARGAGAEKKQPILMARCRAQGCKRGGNIMSTESYLELRCTAAPPCIIACHRECRKLFAFAAEAKGATHCPTPDCPGPPRRIAGLRRRRNAPPPTQDGRSRRGRP